jgi:hypothetical protein
MYRSRVAADVSRRYLRDRENAPTAVSGYAPLAQRDEL